MLINVFNDIEEATNQIKKAIDVEPSAENYLLLSRVCEQKKDFSCAISAYDKVLELEKNRSTTLEGACFIISLTYVERQLPILKIPSSSKRALCLC